MGALRHRYVDSDTTCTQLDGLSVSIVFTEEEAMAVDRAVTGVFLITCAKWLFLY